MAKSWFNVKAQANGVVDVSIHDEIGMWGVTARDFIASIRETNPQTINLSIHSPGGSFFDGLAIYNALRASDAAVNGRVEGLAASAASLILMAADKITIPENAYIMIHAPWAVVVGDADEMRDTADVMEKFKQTLVNVYESRTGGDRAEIEALVNQEHWMDGAEAVSRGFADEMVEAMDVAACALDQTQARHFASLPKSLRPGSEAPEVCDTVRKFEASLRDAGLSHKEAAGMVAKAKELFGRDDSDEDVAETALAAISGLRFSFNK